jgi:hypothetical protein
MKKALALIIITAAVLLGCTHKVETKSQVELAPVEIKPIHITIDINIKVDKELDKFFSDIDQES